MTLPTAIFRTGKGTTVSRNPRARFDPQWWKAVLSRLRTAPVVCLDVETSGLDWKHNHIVGYVFAFSGDPQDSFYLPVRHAGGGNILGVTGPQTATGWDGRPHPIEPEIIRCLNDAGTLGRLVFGHHLGFDLKMLWRLGLRPHESGVWFEDTQINAALLDEYQGQFGLEACCNLAGVQAKKSEEIKAHLQSQFPDTKKDPMSNYWRLAGDDPQGVEYAEGDGTSTWQLRDWQWPHLGEQDLVQVHEIECRLIPYLVQMTCRGMKVNEERVQRVIDYVDSGQVERDLGLPEGFNCKAPSQVTEWLRSFGCDHWGQTPTGKPQLNEAWLSTFPEGQKIVQARRYRTLRDSFMLPLLNTHLWNGRVHPNYHQSKMDEYGVETGRLSCSDPNMQQASKRNPDIGRLHRSCLVPDEGKTWGSADYAQCLAAGTQVMVPSGTKNIEDVQVGDWVYSYDNTRKLVLRRVTWSGKTGIRPLFRVRWGTNGRTQGHLDLTWDHKIRLRDGGYVTVRSLLQWPTNSRNRLHIPVLALRRGRQTTKRETRNYLFTDGYRRLKESRFVFEQVNGWSPEVVHHKDENCLNDTPDNLEGKTRRDHGSQHSLADWAKRPQEERIRWSRRATEGLRQRFKNHYIVSIEPLPGLHPVYDITVDDTHNFIANEICVHNCEPVLLAVYSRSRVLVDGFMSDPPVDAHSSVTKAINRQWSGMTDEEFFGQGIDKTPEFKAAREIGKRVNQTLLTGGGQKVLTQKYGIPPDEVKVVWANYFAAMPEIKQLQWDASRRMRRFGFVRSLLGRRCRLPYGDRSMAYVALNRLLQGGNADILKLKMVQISDYLRAENWPVDLLNNVHDSLDFQFDEADRPHYDECLRIMTDFDSEDQPIRFNVPLRVDADTGDDWAVATFGPSPETAAFFAT